MLRPRIIPCLLIQNRGLVKTQKFGSPKYVGDPINAVKVFNEKEVDELIVLDIDATAQGREPDYAMIANLAAECRMPLCYGGGIRSVAHAEKVIAQGVEKVAISSAAVATPVLISQIAEVVGRQSVVVVLDVKKIDDDGRYEVHIGNGKSPTGLNPFDFAQRAADLGAGEILVNSIDNDGAMKGYDMALVAGVRERVSVPVTALGGAGTLQDIGKLIAKFGVVGAAAGSMFVFKGVYRAVLISYPSPQDKDALISASIPR